MLQSALIAGFIPEKFGEYRISVSIPKTELSLADMRSIFGKLKNKVPNRERTNIGTYITGEHYHVLWLRISHCEHTDLMPKALTFCDALECTLGRRVIIDGESIPKE